MTTWFTSDLHLFHKNIIGLCSRPFENLEEMHGHFIREWRRKVRPNEDVYILGDLSFGGSTDTALFLYSLPGHKFLVKGNHDKNKHIPIEHFEWVKDYHELNLKRPGGKKKKIVMSHYPFASWNQMHYGSWMLHGHSHGTYNPEKGRILDVGYDNVGLLISLENVEEYMRKREKAVVDHHES